MGPTLVVEGQDLQLDGQVDLAHRDALGDVDDRRGEVHDRPDAGLDHAVGDGAKNKVGPELNGLDGRKSGTVEGYSYSDANKNSGITWNEAEFKEYIRDPKAKIPGTKMAFAGIKNDKEVNDLWAFISQYDKDGKTK